MDGMVNKRPVALIAGINGQDGSYMAELLVANGYYVYGITRDPSLTMSRNVCHLADSIKLFYSSYELHQLVGIIKNIQPDEIFNFAGQSYVSKSWEMVEETIHSQGVITSRFLEAILATNTKIRFLNASSSEIFGLASTATLNEASMVQPYNPYGCAKALAHCMVDTYRNSKGIFAVNAILFPHESPRRAPNFAFKKIIKAAVEIKNGSQKKLELGNLHVFRDWGYAPSFVTAMHRMLIAENPMNLCLCTGQAKSIQEVVSAAFSMLGMDWAEHVIVDSTLIRVFEPNTIVGDPSKAFLNLEWEATPPFEELIARMIEFENRRVKDNESDFRNEAPIFFS